MAHVGAQRDGTEDDFRVQVSPVARKRPVGQTQPGALLTSPPWGASGQPGNVAARPRIVRGRVPSTRERGVCTPLADTPEHGPASPSSLRDAPRAGARFAQGNGVHAVGHAGDFLMIFLKKKKKPRTRGKRRHGQTAHGVASPTPRFVRHRRNFTCDPRPGPWDSLAVCWLHRARRAHPMFPPVFSVCPGNGVCLWN